MSAPKRRATVKPREKVAAAPVEKRAPMSQSVSSWEVRPPPQAWWP